MARGPGVGSAAGPTFFYRYLELGQVVYDIANAASRRWAERDLPARSAAASSFAFSACVSLTRIAAVAASALRGGRPRLGFGAGFAFELVGAFLEGRGAGAAGFFFGAGFFAGLVVAMGYV